MRCSGVSILGKLSVEVVRDWAGQGEVELPLLTE